MGCVQSREPDARALPSKVYPAGKLQWHSACSFGFRRLRLPFVTAFAVLKELKPMTFLVLNKNDYFSEMKVILNDSSNFQRLSIDQNKVLNHIVHLEYKIIDVLKK